MAYKDVARTLHRRYKGVTGRYRTLQDVAGRYRTLQDVTGRYRTLQGRYKDATGTLQGRYRDVQGRYKDIPLVIAPELGIWTQNVRKSSFSEIGRASKIQDRVFF
jgi:hypothetical protein